MAKSSVFKQFGMSKSLEREGIWLEYDDIKFLVARAGGSNLAYQELLKAKIRPVRHQIERDSLPKEEDNRINAELYAETVIKDVQVKGEDGLWTRGVPKEDGTVLPYSTGAVITLLLELPELFRDLRTCATDSVKYLKDQERADTKNS